MQLEAQTGWFCPSLCVSACLKPSHLSGVQKPQVISLMSSGIYFKGISYIWLQKMRADVCNRGEGCEQSVLWSSHPLCSIHFQPIKFLKQITIQMTNELTWKKILNNCINTKVPMTIPLAVQSWALFLSLCKARECSGSVVTKVGS